jgi:molybdopterin-containing oxidoreductase family membrane subunit
MAAESLIIGLFIDEEQAAQTVRDLKGHAQWRVRNIHSPIPSTKMARAFGAKKSLIGWCTLAGGITGFFTGFLLAAFTSARWGLIVSGKPVMAWVPFIIVGFEFTVLFAVFGNIAGLVAMAKLPDYQRLKTYHPKCSGEHYGVVAACDPDQRSGLLEYFRSQGAEAEELNQVPATGG